MNGIGVWVSPIGIGVSVSPLINGVGMSESLNERVRCGCVP